MKPTSSSLSDTILSTLAIAVLCALALGYMIRFPFGYLLHPVLAFAESLLRALLTGLGM